MKKVWVLKEKGFTIVELLIVIVVIAILAAITIVGYNGIQKRAYWSQIYSEVHALSIYFDSYQIDNGAYPTDKTALHEIFTKANVTVGPGWTYGYCATDAKYYLFPANSKAGVYGAVATNDGISHRKVYQQGVGWFEADYPDGPELVATRVCTALIPGEHFESWADQ
jgi:prepilin-type N-terminal cleavage/methylation domain-containing protein